MVHLIHFSDPLPSASEDYPAAERSIGVPPLRTTYERYLTPDGISMGEWKCQPGAWRIRFHENRHEFFHVLSGRIRITDQNNNSRDIHPGEACIIPAGFVGIFEVLESVHKRYVMIDR
jgi:uncharacterized protein